MENIIREELKKASVFRDESLLELVKDPARSGAGLFYPWPLIKPLEPKDCVLYFLERTRSTKFPNGVKGFDFAGREYPVLDTIRCIRKDNLSQIPLY